MRQSVPTVTAWLDRQKPPMPVIHEVTLPEGTKKLLVTVSPGGCGSSGECYLPEGQKTDAGPGETVIRY